MVKDAEANADTDKKRKELVEARNAADSAVHTTEKALTDHGDALSGDEKSAIETAIAELKEVKDGDDLEEIKAKTEAVTQASMKLGEAMYKAAQAEAEAGEQPSSATDDDGETVVDADFEEVDDDKKDKS